MLKVAILASGSGTNFQAIIDKIKAGILKAEVGIVISNRPDARVLERAARAGIAAHALDHTAFASREEFDAAMLRLLARDPCDLIVLAGYMRLLSSLFLNSYQGRIINIHPALLPAFPGTHGIRDALAYGARLAGPSVHFVEERMDSGPLIIQAALPVNVEGSEDELASAIHALEHRIYPQAIQWIAEERLKVDGRKVILAPGKSKRIAPEPGFIVSPPLEEGF